jgi:uncharacterized protein YbcV (DUF1398 family)
LLVFNNFHTNLIPQKNYHWTVTMVTHTNCWGLKEGIKLVWHSSQHILDKGKSRPTHEQRNSISNFNKEYSNQ